MTGRAETLEEFLARLHCSQVDFEQLASWYFDERVENTILRETLEHIERIPLTTRESAVAVGFNGAMEDCHKIAREALAKVRGDE